MKMRKITSIEILNKKFYVFAVLSFLDSIISNHKKVDISRYNKLRFVVGEVLKNRIETSYPGEEGTLWVELFMSDTYFEVSIRDKGVPIYCCGEEMQELIPGTTEASGEKQGASWSSIQCSFYFSSEI